MDNSTRENLDSWIREDNGKPKLILIYGPTACGKSGLAVEIGEYLKEQDKNPFVISVDARQIYRGLDIGTGKIKESEMGGIPHSMLDIIDPDESFSVVDFRTHVESLENWKKWEKGDEKTIPILCGGTGLYIDALIFERSYPKIEADEELRRELEDFRVQYGNEALWKKLAEIDPEYANILHPNNYHYVIRGIEVMVKSGKSKLSSKDTGELRYDTFFVTPYDGDREKLYERINLRVDEMFSAGLIDEVGYNMHTFNSSVAGFATIGYREVVDHLEGRISLEECISLVKQHNRNYAKRQITWNKKYVNTDPSKHLK